jgi:hypothetical protein
MTTFRRIVTTILLASILGLTGNVAAASAAPGGYAPLPQVTGSLDASCTQAVPVPTIVAEVTNNKATDEIVGVEADGVLIQAFVAPAGQTTQWTHATPQWEDDTVTFTLITMTATLDTHVESFDCLHPILDVSISSSCRTGLTTVHVENSGSEGTHVDILVDGAVAGIAFVAPGHSATVKVAASAGQLVEAVDLNSVLASHVVPRCKSGSWIGGL